MMYVLVSTEAEYIRNRRFFFFIGHPLCRIVLPGIPVILTLCCGLIGASPYVLSHPSGLQAALAVANAISPVATIQVDSIHAQWTRPVKITGVRIVAKRPDRSSTPGSGSGSSGSDSGAESLFEARSIRTSRSLWDVVWRGSGEHGRRTTVLVSDPKLDATLNEAGVLRVVQALQDSGLVPKVPSTIQGRTGSENEGLRWNVPRSLQVVAAAVPFSGEVRARSLQLAISDGELLVPEEFR